MRIVDVPTGEWFMDGVRGIYVKMDPFRRGNGTYHAVRLPTGEPAFPAQTSSADSPALSNADVTLITKPSEMKLYRLAN